MAYIDIENYKDSEGEVNYDKFNADLRKLRQSYYDAAIATFEDAQQLARLNGFDLLQHASPWHFSLTRYENGKKVWRLNLYPFNQHIWADPKVGKAPFLKVPKPWTFLDIVTTAIAQSQAPPVNLVKELSDG